MRIAKPVLALAASAAFGTASAQPQTPDAGPGMLGGPPAGMQGRGYGPGMTAPGMTGPGMMGPMGPGAMRGYRGASALWSLDLSDAQRSQILKIEDDARRRNWDLLGQAQDQMAKLRDAYLAPGKLDRNAVMAAYRRIADLRLQRIDNALDAAEKIENVLSTQQRDELKRRAPWWAADLAR